MSQLRNNLQTARSEYESLQYSGDLVGDVRARVIEPKHTLGYIGRLVRVGIAIAALVAIVLVGRSILQSKDSSVTVNPTIADATPTTNQSTDESLPSFASISVPSWSDVAEVAVASSKDQASQTIEQSTSWPSMPRFPSIDQIDAASATKTLNSSSDEEIQ